MKKVFRNGLGSARRRRRRTLFAEQLEERQLLAADTGFSLQLLHASDLEGGINAIGAAPNFAAIESALEQAAEANTDIHASITLSAGDNFIPGPFFNAAGNADTFRPLFEGFYNEFFGLIDTSDLPANADVDENGFFDNSEIDDFLGGPDNTSGLTAGDVYVTDVNGDGFPDYFDEIDNFEGRVDISIMNVIGFDASALGNHEFDLGTDALENIINYDSEEGNGLSGVSVAAITEQFGDDAVNFLQEVDWPGAQFPYLSSNLDFTADGDAGDLFTDDILLSSSFESDLVSAREPLPDSEGDFPVVFETAGDVPDSNDSKIAPSTVIERGGELIGVIGATTPLLEEISSPGLVDVLPESDLISELAELINAEVDRVQAAYSGLDKIVLVSHLQQFSIESEELAPLLSGVDIIVAGGSDTIVADQEDVLRGLQPGDEPDVLGYPVFVDDFDSNPIAVVSTNGEYSYVGRLVIEFDENGVVIPESVDETVSGIFATTSEQVDSLYEGLGLSDPFAPGTPGKTVSDLVAAVTDVVNTQDGNVAGRSGVFINGLRADVRTQETNLGNLTADANLVAAQSVDPSVVVSLKNGGGIRAPIGEITATGERLPTAANPTAGKVTGEVSQLDIENSLRFNNGLTLLTVTAAELVQILEHGVSATAPGATPGQFPQVGGMSFSFDPSLPAGNRVQSVAIVDALGIVTDSILKDGEMLGDPDREIRMVTLNFLAGGGDGYDFDPNEDGNAEVETGIGEQTALFDFLEANHSTVPYYTNDTPIEQDRRIQNLQFRTDSVLSEVESNELTFNVLSRLTLGGSEISAYDPTTNNFFVTSGGGLQIVDYSDPAAPVLTETIDATTFGFNNTEFTSVAVSTADESGSVVVAALPNINPENEDDKTVPGNVLVFDGLGNLIESYEVGPLPDMVTFVPGTHWVLVANEGESSGSENEPDAELNPEGSVSLINLDDGTVQTFGFDDPSITFDSLADKGVRVNRAAPSAAADLEPEFISVNGTQAFITLQENNAVAVINDVTNFSGFTIDDILPLGKKDHTLPFNKLDPSNRDSGINIQNLPVFGLYMPDAIASYEVGGETYFVIANEGDGRDVDETRIGDYGDGESPELDPNAILFQDDLQLDENLGRLKSSNVDGDLDGDLDIDEINVFGSRSFSIFSESGELIYDSGDFFERKTADELPEIFNSDESDPSEFDERSDDKGPEPEGVALGTIGDETYAFIGLERIGGIMIYNVTNPDDVSFVDYLFVDGDQGPEGLTFVPASDSPTSNPLLVITNEDSDTLTTVEIPLSNPGFSYVDANNNQLFDSGSDMPLVEGELNDGRFSTNRSEGGYQEVIPGAGLFVAEDIRARRSLELNAEGDIILADGLDLTARRGLELNAGSDLDVSGSNLFSWRSVELEAGGDVTGDDARIRGIWSISIDAGGQVQLDDAFITALSVEIAAAAAISVEDAFINGIRTVEVRSGGDLNADNALIASFLNIDLQSRGSISLEEGDLRTFREIEIDAVDSIFAASANMWAGRTIEIESETGSVEIQGARLVARREIAIDAVIVLTDEDTVLDSRNVDINEG
ncbi:MAG: choice-of-anchor I family protein [Planctomycetota bacterium]